MSAPQETEEKQDLQVFGCIVLKKIRNSAAAFECISRAFPKVLALSPCLELGEQS